MWPFKTPEKLWALLGVVMELGIPFVSATNAPHWYQSLIGIRTLSCLLTHPALQSSPRMSKCVLTLMERAF